MNKTITLTTVILLLLVTPVFAWINCSIPSCPEGYTDNGTSCSGSICSRQCYLTSCDISTWTQEFSDTSIYMEEDEGYLRYDTDTYTPSNTSLCYKFSYVGPEDSDSRIKLYPDDSNPPSNDHDTESIAVLIDHTSSTNPWFKDMNNSGYYNATYLGLTNPYFDQVEYSLRMMRAHDENENDGVTGPDYRDDVSIDTSIYCAPTSAVCENIANTSPVNICNTSCYNQATKLRVIQGYFYDYGYGDDYNLYTKNQAQDGEMILNRLHYPGFYAYSAPRNKTVYVSQECNCSNEVPTASDVKVLPLNATAGDDLLCNFSYSDPENFSEQNSSYEWWKNGANQNINNQILTKGNLSIGDEWYCKVAASDGLNTSSLVQSSNVVRIRTTVANVSLLVDGQEVWNASGYYSQDEFIIDFSSALQDALNSCTSDSEGYCEISLSIPSDAEGSLNLSSLVIYLEGQQDMYVAVKTASDSYDTDDNILLTGSSLGTLTQFSNGNSTENLSFSGSQDITRYLSLPRYAIVTSATIDLSGMSNASFLEDDTEDAYWCNGNFSSACSNAVDENWSSKTYSQHGNYSLVYENYTVSMDQAEYTGKFGVAGEDSLDVDVWCWAGSSWNNFASQEIGGFEVENVTAQIPVSCLSSSVLQLKTMLYGGTEGVSPGSRHDYYDSLITWITSAYTENITIDSGNDGSPDYINQSPFNNTADNINLNTTALNAALNNGSCDCVGCSLSDDNCLVPVVFHSDTTGVIEYSDISIAYNDTGVSLLGNDEGTNITYYLLLIIQKFDAGAWTNDTILLDESSPRILLPNQTLSLVEYWNNNTASVSSGTGTYRAYVAITDENNIPLLDKDSSYLVATHNFSVSGSGTGMGEDIDVNSFNALFASGTERIFRFVAENIGDGILSEVNWTFLTGESTSHAKELGTLQENEDVFMFFQHDYSETGVFTANASAFNPSASDTESLEVNLDAFIVSALARLHANSTLQHYRFIIENNLNYALNNASWKLDTDEEILNAVQHTPLQPSTDAFVIVAYEYGSGGTYAINATAINSSLSHSQNITVTI